MAEEIELKLLIQPEDHQHLAAYLQRWAGVPSVKHLKNIYFDTPALDLNQHKTALRLRHSSSGWVQTLKTSGASQGVLSHRGEWETPVDGASLMPERLPSERLQADWLSQLQPVFSTDFTRTSWALALTHPDYGVGSVEICADQGQVYVPGREGEDPISEVELELVEGDPRLIFDALALLQKAVSLQPGLASKAQRGLRLFQPKALKPLDLALSSQTLDWAGLLELAGRQLNQWIQTYEHWLFDGDEQHLEKGILALLRLQGLLVTLQRVCPQAPLREPRIELKRLLRAFLPLRLAREKDRMAQSLRLALPLGYEARRAELRQLWQTAWTGQASLSLVQGLYLCRDRQPSQPLPDGLALLQAACAHLRFPRQPLDAKLWQQRYPALVRLEWLAEGWPQVPVVERRRLTRLRQGIEEVMGLQQLQQQPLLKSSERQLLDQRRESTLLQLGRDAQALWTEGGIGAVSDE